MLCWFGFHKRGKVNEGCWLDCDDFVPHIHCRRCGRLLDYKGK